MLIAVAGTPHDDPTPLLLAAARSGAVTKALLVGCPPSEGVSHALPQEAVDAVPDGVRPFPANGVCRPSVFARLRDEPGWAPPAVAAGARAAYEFDGYSVPPGAAAECGGKGDVVVFGRGEVGPAGVPLTRPGAAGNARWFDLSWSPETGSVLASGKCPKGTGCSATEGPPHLLLLDRPFAFGPAPEFRHDETDAVCRAARAAWLALRAGDFKAFGQALGRAWAAERAARLRSGPLPAGVDAAYALALGAGAWGGGAFAGGLALVAPPSAHDEIRKTAGV